MAGTQWPHPPGSPRKGDVPTRPAPPVCSTHGAACDRRHLVVRSEDERTSAAIPEAARAVLESAPPWRRDPVSYLTARGWTPVDPIAVAADPHRTSNRWRDPQDRGDILPQWRALDRARRDDARGVHTPVYAAGTGDVTPAAADDGRSTSTGGGRG